MVEEPVAAGGVLASAGAVYAMAGARVINADADLQASKKPAEAARQMSDAPVALQLRLLQTVMAVAAQQKSTLMLPISVDLLRFLEKGAQ